MGDGLPELEIVDQQMAFWYAKLGFYLSRSPPPLIYILMHTGVVREPKKSQKNASKR